jgi:hypothetical protein
MQSEANVIKAKLVVSFAFGLLYQQLQFYRSIPCAVRTIGDMRIEGS